LSAGTAFVATAWSARQRTQDLRVYGVWYASLSASVHGHGNRRSDWERQRGGGGLFYSDISRDCPSPEIRLERVEGVSQFTRYTTYATLTIPPVGDAARALALLEKADYGCLVANSVKGERHLEVQIVY
jgi:hypothetical protein